MIMITDNQWINIIIHYFRYVKLRPRLHRTIKSLTSRSVDLGIELNCLQDIPLHKLHTPGRLVVVQQDHVDQAPILTMLYLLTVAKHQSQCRHYETHTHVHFELFSPVTLLEKTHTSIGVFLRYIERIRR